MQRFIVFHILSLNVVVVSRMNYFGDGGNTSSEKYLKRRATIARSTRSDTINLTPRDCELRRHRRRGL